VLGYILGDFFRELISPLCLSAARFFFLQILTSLNYLHKRNVAHCDLKPENILLVSSRPDPDLFHDPSDPTFYPHQVILPLATNVNILQDSQPRSDIYCFFQRTTLQYPIVVKIFFNRVRITFLSVLQICKQ
jgi:serine/threonine protein kinase